ncbi:MAG: hypothetical protein EA352_10260 [Gemmatimonadales bacterium]|nr:MAG: hypothetical protein EA352_10260 [Gemmatimonadales bacterium]
MERRDWEAAAELEPRTPDYLEWDRYAWPEALSWYARGLGLVHTGDVEGAREAEVHMAELRDTARDTGEDAMATYIEVDRLILDAWIRMSEGEAEAALELARDAAELEATVEKHPITPGALLPPWEVLGELHLELDEPNEALTAFESGLEVWPERLRSLEGVERAREALQDR